VLVDRAVAWLMRGGAGPMRIRSAVHAAAPADAVWERVSDIPSQPRWMHDLKDVRILSPGPVGVGTRMEGHVRILGIPAPDPVVITAWDPPRRYAIRHLGPFKGRGEIVVKAERDGTSVVTWEETLVAPILPNIAALVLRPVLERVFRADLDRLRRLVESRPVESRA
jgi:hypothetical protein